MNPGMAMIANSLVIDGIWYELGSDPEDGGHVATVTHISSELVIVNIPPYIIFENERYYVRTIKGDLRHIFCSGNKTCTNLTIPNTVRKIGAFAFQKYTGLTSIIIPDGVTEIGKNAFCGCTGLTSIFIPKTVVEISENPFSYCNSLSNIHVSDENSTYFSIDGVLFSRKMVLMSYPVGKKYNRYSLPKSVTTIGIHAFEGCNRLKSIIIPDGVTEIGMSAFKGCSGLTSIVIPESVTWIGDDAFDLGSGSCTIYSNFNEETFNTCISSNVKFYYKSLTDYEKILKTGNPE